MSRAGSPQVRILAAALGSLRVPSATGSPRPQDGLSGDPIALLRQELATQLGLASKSAKFLKSKKLSLTRELQTSATTWNMLWAHIASRAAVVAADAERGLLIAEQSAARAETAAARVRAAMASSEDPRSR